MILVTSKRLRSIISECKTDADLVANLRRHKISYGYTTETGFLSVVIPCSTGKVRVYRTASKSNPFRVVTASPAKSYYNSLDNHYYM